MSPWRLELLRVWRTGRMVALAATFLILGFGIPILTYYLPELIKHGTNGVQITVPKQTPADAMTGFAGNIGQLGTLVVAIVAAANLVIDARPGLAAFYRTRIYRPFHLILPRYVIVTSATLVALVLGTVAAWYETAVLLGTVSVGDLFVGLVLEALWFCFVTSIVAAFTGVLRGVLGVVGCSVVFLLALALLGNLPAVSSWLPTRLSAASAVRFAPHSAGDLWHAVIVTVIMGAVAFSLALYRLGRREL